MLEPRQTDSQSTVVSNFPQHNRPDVNSKKMPRRDSPAALANNMNGMPAHDEIEISVVVPVYCSAITLPELHRRVVATLENITQDFEIILVEDCGRDNSWEVIEKLANQDPRVRGIKLSRNFGQHAATICGCSTARGRWVFTLDDDLEHQPEFISDIYSKAKEGFSLVYGVYPQRTHSAWRNITSEIGRKMFRFAIPSLNYSYTSFRCIRGKLARELTRFDSPFPFVDGYLSWITHNCASVPVVHASRVSGVSNYNFRKLFAHSINIFVTFSDLPLRLASWLGLGAFLIGMLWLGTILIGKLLGDISVSGYASVMAGIVLFGGIQLLILGIIGEYLGRVNFQSSRRPLYLVARDTRQRTGDE